MHLLTLVHILHYQIIQYLVCPSPNLYAWPIGGPRQILPIPTPDSSNPGPRCSPPELDLLKSPQRRTKRKIRDRVEETERARPTTPHPFGHSGLPPAPPEGGAGGRPEGPKGWGVVGRPREADEHGLTPAHIPLPRSSTF